MRSCLVQENIVLAEFLRARAFFPETKQHRFPRPEKKKVEPSEWNHRELHCRPKSEPNRDVDKGTC